MKRVLLFLTFLLALGNICFAQDELSHWHKKSLNSDTNGRNADVNGDGAVNAADIVAIVKIIMNDGNEDENPVSQKNQNIEDFVDVSKFNNYMDWHYVKVDIPTTKETDEYATMKMPDWVLYAAARTALPPHDLLNISCAKWNERYIYLFSSLWETLIFYDEDGNWMGENPPGFGSLDFNELGNYETKAEPFDPTSMFGQRINNRLVGIWKREVAGTNGNPDYTAYVEFRSNGSGHTWREEDGVNSSESRFLYTIEDGPTDPKSKDWVVVKMAYENRGMTSYVNYVVEGDSMYNVGDYDFMRDDKSSYYHRVIQ
jgi:hypothetical protein